MCLLLSRCDAWYEGRAVTRLCGAGQVVYSANVTRREILRQSALQAGAVWALMGQDHGHEHSATPSPGGLKFFTPDQAKDVEAVAERIIPADDTPGAREAGVVTFIDLLLSEFEPDRRAAYTTGLEMLTARSGGPFSNLAADRQNEVLRSIETTEFFNLIRQHTVMGFFSHPKYGGNRNKAGWKLIGFEDSFVFHPPFGYYDGPEGLSKP